LVLWRGFAELLAQNAWTDLLDRALDKLPELERSVGDADEAVDLEIDLLQQFAYLAVLSFLERDGDPGIAPIWRALRAVDARMSRPVFDAVDHDAARKPVEALLRRCAENPDAIAPRPAGARQFQAARQLPVIGEQEQPFGVEIETADGDDTRQIAGERREDGLLPCGSRWVVTSPAGL
jgi:hypothetical protein